MKTASFRLAVALFALASTSNCALENGQNGWQDEHDPVATEAALLDPLYCTINVPAPNVALTPTTPLGDNGYEHIASQSPNASYGSQAPYRYVVQVNDVAAGLDPSAEVAWAGDTPITSETACNRSWVEYELYAFNTAANCWQKRGVSHSTHGAWFNAGFCYLRDFHPFPNQGDSKVRIAARAYQRVPILSWTVDMYQKVAVEYVVR